MRIITGLYKGRILKTVKDLSVRPATDRVKQTIFDMLATRVDLDGASVLDLFAGSGSLGIEALSRGAERAVFVETSPAAIASIEANLAMLDCNDAAEIHETDALAFITRSNEHYDIIFADPPYEFDETQNIPEIVFTSGILKRYGMLIIEHATSLRFESTQLYNTGPEKKFGRTVVTFFTHRKMEGTHNT
jgi:16S rRNA (guanine966-N2)-methyltransferase